MLSPGLLCTSSHNNTIKQDEGEGGGGWGGGVKKTAVQVSVLH